MFGRSQLSSLTATGAEYLVLYGLVLVFHVWYVVATALGAIAGSITSFLINRHWSFEAWDGHVRRQAIRYFIVALGSMILNTAGVYFLKDHGNLPLWLSVGLVGLLVGFFYNFPLHRRYVFR